MSQHPSLETPPKPGPFLRSGASEANPCRPCRGSRGEERPPGRTASSPPTLVPVPRARRRRKEPCIFPDRHVLDGLGRSLVCISDTHNAQPPVPDGDILIHAGDLSSSGSADEIRTNIDWISSLPHPIKIVIGGNHDKALDAKYRERARAHIDEPGIDWLASGITYLEHSSTKVSVRGREPKFFGPPFTPEYGPWAFQYPQFHLLPERAREVWEAIPLDTDIMITHGPPLNHMDLTTRGQRAGCPALLERLWQVQPVLHVFGHIHEGRGAETLRWGTAQSFKEATPGGQKTSKVVHALRSVVGHWLGTGFKAKRHTQLVNGSIRPAHLSGSPLNEAQVICI